MNNIIEMWQSSELDSSKAQTKVNVKSPLTTSLGVLKHKLELFGKLSST